MREKKREEPRSFGHRNLKRVRHHKADSRWKEIEVPKKEITISLADAQIRQESGSGPRKTLVAHHLWQTYILRARALGEDVSDYDRYCRRHPKGAKPKVQIQMPNGHPIEAYGPFNCKLSIGPVQVRMPVLVTSDPHLGSDFVLGRYDWLSVMALKTTHATQVHSTNAAHISCQGPRNCELKTLVDTGAGPNVLSWHALIKMGYSKKDLEPNRYKLSMVDDSELTTKGYLPNLRVCLADAELEVPCTVVKGLGTDELILGREFLNKYDVLLDLPRRELTIRNPHGRCQTVETLEEVKESHFLAVPRMQAKIAPETICCVNYDVKEAQQVTLGGRTQKKGSWLATVDSLDDYYQERNVTIPKVVLTVRDGMVTIPLLNNSWKKNDVVELPPRRGILRVKALREVYCRRVVDDDAEEMCYTLRIDEKDEIVSAVWEGSRDSDMDSQCTSEPPIEIAKQPNRFITCPRIEHLRRTLSETTMGRLERILSEHEDVFSKNKTDVGRVSDVQHEIRLKKGVEPHRESYRRLHPHKRECADRQIQEFLDKGFISPSQSPFSLGVVMIKKPDGTYRMSVDFRKLNAMTEKESYPLPKLEETLERLSETKYYSTLDMSRGTWQIPLSEESKEHTAFVTHRGQYHWNYLPAGLCNGRATFQRLMTKVLANVAQTMAM